MKNEWRFWAGEGVGQNWTLCSCELSAAKAMVPEPGSCPADKPKTNKRLHLRVHFRPWEEAHGGGGGHPGNSHWQDTQTQLEPRTPFLLRGKGAKRCPGEE